MQILAILALMQMPWTSHLPERGIAIDFLRPKFDGGGTSLTSGAAYLSIRAPVGSGNWIKLEFPYARVAASGFSSSTIGNPYVGLEKGVATNLRFEGGVRIPVTSETEQAAIMGLYGDVTRLEAFLPNVLTIAARLHYQRTDSNGFTLDGGGGPSIWAPTEGGGDPEVIAHYHFSAGYRGPTAWMAVGVGGVMILTENLSLSERTIYQLGASAGLSRGQVRPAIHVIIPLDEEVKSNVDVIVGLGVAIAFK